MEIFPGGPGGFRDDGLSWLHDLFWLLIVIALVVGAFLVVRAVLDHPGGGRAGAGHRPPPTAALVELDLRYARGEVDRIEYLQRRADLLGHPAPDPGPPATPAGPAKR
jgi:putative membrane protein